MYQRSYYPSEENPVCPPREYDGSLNFEKEEARDEPVLCEPQKIADEKRKSPLSLLEIFPKGLFSNFELGIEEILIIGAAIFLFMSKSGDFECIFILIALLFVR